MSSRKKAAPLLVALIATLSLAACGSSDSGEDKVNGSFERLPGAPDSYANVSGEAELSRSDGGTTTTISLDGLVPETEYMAHLHSGGCEGADPGGPHFKFDPAGSDEPPNEIHLSFSSDGDGSGEAEASSDEEVPMGEAGSIVVHLAGHEKMAALFVHEGVDHSKEGEGHGGGAQTQPGNDDEHEDEGGEAHESSDRIACANLEAGDAEAAADTGPVPTIEIRNDEPVGGIQELEFSAGEEIRFEVSSDSAEEIHVHGYDIAKDVPAGGSVEFSFPAEIEGIFEVELEDLGTQIAELRVNP